MARTNITESQARRAGGAALKDKLDEHDGALDTLELAASITTITKRSLLGRKSATDGAVEEISSASDGQVLVRAAGVLAFGKVVTDGIDDLAVTNDQIDDATIEREKLAPTLMSAPEEITGAGAVDPDVPTTLITTDGSLQAITIADGSVEGSRKRIVHHVDGGSWRITASGAVHLGASIATITSTAARDWVELEWDGTSWNVIGHGGSGVTFA